MNIYKKMYLSLFNAVTDALSLLPEEHRAARLLRDAQCRCEEEFIRFEEKCTISELKFDRQD